MRRRTIIQGFKNSQKIRFILTAKSGEDFGMTITIQQMSDQFATTEARAAIWNALVRLASSRRVAKDCGESPPIGIVTDSVGFKQVQVDLY